MARHNHLAQIIEQEVAALSPKMREVYQLSREEYLNNKEIAQVLGLTEDNVKMRLYRAMAILKKRLKSF